LNRTKARIAADGAMRLLSLDGGGVKGISSLMILDATMERVKQIEQGKGLNDNSQRLPIKYLDLAGGDKYQRSCRLVLEWWAFEQQSD
jgi:patatin-like phospholipase/acyl hydrolase